MGKSSWKNLQHRLQTSNNKPIYEDRATVRATMGHRHEAFLFFP